MKFNVLFGAISFIICTITAIKLTKNLELKRIFFEELNSFNNSLETHVSYTKTPILEIIKNYNGQLKTYLENFFIKNNELTKKELPFLNEKELKFVNEYLGTIGKSDYSSQLNVIKINSQKILDNLNISKEKEEKQKPLTIKLGIFIGLIIFILLL